MKPLLSFLFGFWLSIYAWSQVVSNVEYLDSLKKELTVKWPANRTINLVFHGHSVPAGYFRTREVHTLEAYPMVTLRLIKEKYPFAVVNCITTSIGGEDSEKGQNLVVKEIMKWF
jgi:acyl-CoA thioesterase I